MRRNPRRIYLALDELGECLGYNADWKTLVASVNANATTGRLAHRIVAFDRVSEVRWPAKPKGRRKA